MSEPFRSATTDSTESTEAIEATDKPVVDQTSTSQTHAPDLFATFEEDIGTPYTAKYLEVESVWDQEPALKRDVKEIEGYIREQVKKGKVANNTKAAKALLTEMERKVGLSRYESGSQRIQKLLAYIDMRKIIDE